MSKRSFALLKYALLIIFYIMAAWRLTFLFILDPGLPVQKRTILSTTLQGNAHKPFAYRMLIPTIVNGVTYITPEGLKEATLQFAERYKWNSVYFEKKFGWEKDYLFENMVVTAIIFGLFLSTLFAFRSLIYSFYRVPMFIVDLAPLANILLLPMFFVITDYTYDPAVLFFSAFLLLLIQKRSHLWFLLIFILACVNKETAVLFSFIFLLKEYGRMSDWHLTGWMVLFLTIAMAIKLTLFEIYKDNNGNFLSMHLSHNWDTLIFNSSYPPYLHFATILWAFLLIFQWTRKPSFLRKAFLVIFIPEFMLGVFFGWIEEIRIFLDAYPMMFLLGLPTIITFFGIPLKGESVIRPS